MLTITLSGGGGGGGHHGGGGGGGGGHHGGGGGGYHYGGGRGPGRGWYPSYNYAPEVVVVQPAVRDCQFTIRLPTGEQVNVIGPCPVGITGPVVAMIRPL